MMPAQVQVLAAPLKPQKLTKSAANKVKSQLRLATLPSTNNIWISIYKNKRATKVIFVISQSSLS